MNARLVAAAAVLAASVTALAGCTSSSSPAKPGSGAAHTTGTPSAAAGAGASADASALAGQLNSALDALTSAHLAIDAGTLGGTSTADVKLADGHATATDTHLSAGGQQVQVVTVGSNSYVKLSKAPDPARPWLAITPNSANPVVKALASGFSVASLTSSLSALGGLLGSSSDLRNEGSAQVGGVASTHYTMQLDPAKGTGNAQLDGVLALLGTAKLPVELWLDGQHRPVQLIIHVSLAGSSFPITVQVGDFDAPLTITAPPAAQIGK